MCTVGMRKKNCLLKMKADTLRQVFFLNKMNFWGFHAVVFVKTFQSMYHLLL